MRSGPQSVDPLPAMMYPITPLAAKFVSSVSPALMRA
jgi:hypothetical protein